jgi:hypothetical protein
MSIRCPECPCATPQTATPGRLDRHNRDLDFDRLALGDPEVFTCCARGPARLSGCRQVPFAERDLDIGGRERNPLCQVPDVRSN